MIMVVYMSHDKGFTRSISGRINQARLSDPISDHSLRGSNAKPTVLMVSLKDIYRTVGWLRTNSGRSQSQRDSHNQHPRFSGDELIDDATGNPR